MTPDEIAAECDASLLRERTARRRRRLVVLLIFLVLVSFPVLVGYQILRLRSQAASNETLKYLAWKLGEFKDSTGRYPDQLGDLDLDWGLTDGWGHPIHYERVADGYVIASFGRDGKSDGLNLSLIRKPHLRSSQCRNHDLDLIRTDLHWYRQCAK